MRRAIGMLLASILAATVAAGREPGDVVASLSSDCKAVALSDPTRVDQVVEQLEALLRTTPRTMTDLSAALRTLPALDHFLDPADPAEVESAVADVFLLTGRLSPAMEAYRRAAESRPELAGRCGAAYGGRVYTFELGRITEHGRSYSMVAPVLLSRDPVTGYVLERFMLPSTGTAFAVHHGILHVIYLDRDHEEGPRSLRFAAGRSAYTVWAPAYSAGEMTNSMARLQSRRGSLNLARNFLYRPRFSFDRMSPEFTLRSDVVEGLPTDLADLEAVLRQAIVEDPTQPWNFFLLGQTLLYAQGRPNEAAAALEELFSGNFPVTPYYEYTHIARYFELYRQPEWADAALREALARRHGSPLPVDWCYAFERTVDIPTRWPFIERDERPGIGVERAYVWWSRVREISGVAEGDEVRAVLWARYFESVGDGERAAAEWAYIDRLREDYPWLRRVAAYYDYLFWALFASCFLVLVLFCTVSIHLFRRIFAKERIVLRSSQASVVAVMSLVFFLSLNALSFASSFLDHLFKEQGNDELTTAPKNRRYSSERHRLRSALASHAAGELAQARKIYETLTPTPLVASNMAAVERNMPPILSEPIAERVGVPFPDVFRNWFRNEFWGPWRTWRLVSEDVWGLAWLLGAALAKRYRLLAVLLTVSLMFVLWRRRLSVRSLVSILVPGAAFLSRGQLIRAYGAVWLFSFATFPLLWLVSGWAEVSAHGGQVGVGMYTTFYWKVILSDEDFAVPPDLDKLLADSFWPLLGVYPHVRLFYLLVAFSLMACLFLQVREIRRLRGGVFRSTIHPAGRRIV